MYLFGVNFGEANIQNPFVEALFDYQCSLERGVYAYSPENNWTNENEINFIEELMKLKELGELFKAIHYEYDDFIEYLIEEQHINFFEIVNLLTILGIYIKLRNINLQEELLLQLETDNFMTKIQASIPSSCFMYLFALRSSSLELLPKLGRSNNLLVLLSKNVNKFGKMDDIVFKEVVEYYADVVNKIGGDLKEKLKERIKNYKILANTRPCTYFNQLSKIEQLTMHIIVTLLVLLVLFKIFTFVQRNSSL